MTDSEMGYGFGGGWGFLIIIILFLVFFTGGGMNFGGWGRGGYGYNGGCGGCTSTCEVERREIIDSARTQYLVEKTARDTQEQTLAGIAALGTKIDFYEYQDLRDQLAAERSKNMALETRIYSDAKFGAIEAQIANINCNMLRRPDVTGIGAVCPNSAIINGLGLGSGFGWGNGCGNGFVTNA
ncbi:MAG: hypothetical protein IJ516_05705 [Phascolarctobacterium sp.]|nr:hypothetical protein [Phascolarctobacterium sp.]